MRALLPGANKDGARRMSHDGGAPRVIGSHAQPAQSMTQQPPSCPQGQDKHPLLLEEGGHRPRAAGGEARTPGWDTMHQHKAKSASPRGEEESPSEDSSRFPAEPGRCGGGAGCWDGPRSGPAGATQAEGHGESCPPGSLGLGLKGFLLEAAVCPLTQTTSIPPCPDRMLAITCCPQTVVASKERQVHRAVSDSQLQDELRAHMLDEGQGCTTTDHNKRTVLLSTCCVGALGLARDPHDDRREGDAYLTLQMKSGLRVQN